MDAQREAVSRYVQNRGHIIVEFIEVESERKESRPKLGAALDVAVHEREMIFSRTRAALAAAKARGIKLGNPRCREALARATFGKTSETILAVISTAASPPGTHRRADHAAGQGRNC
jgi:DNA invertase Pin-like site-specific DNA recombinase